MTNTPSDTPTEGSQAHKRSLWFHLHFWIGWIAALPIALLCLTGALLIFETEIFQWEQKELFNLQVTENPLTVGEVLEAYRNADPPLQVNHLGIPKEPEHSYSAYTRALTPEGSGGRVFLNPYTGELSRLSDGFSISHLIIDIHRHLAAGRIGQQLAAICSVVLAITCLIGLVLWWPLRGRTFARALKRGQALDWHNALGLIATLPLIVMAITGITFTWGRHLWPLLENFQDGPSQNPRPTVVAPVNTEKLPIDPIVELARQAVPNATWTGLQPSNRETSAHAFFFNRNGTPVQLFLNPYTGDELARVEGNANTTGVVSWYRRNFGRLHTFGTYGSIAQFVWGLLSLVGTILVVTGLWISIKRWRRPQRRVT